MVDMRDQVALRNAFSSSPTGVAVVSTFDKLKQHLCMTISSFISLSLEPPLCLYCLEKGARRYSVLAEATEFAINVLAGDQVETALMFSKGNSDEDWQKAGYSIKGVLGMPIINGIKSFFECKKYCQYDGGDHTIIVGKIVSYEIASDKSPLSYVTGNFVDLKGRV